MPRSTGRRPGAARRGRLVICRAARRGLPQRFPGLGDTERGSFGALGDPAVIDYLRRLGVTAVELLPIHAFARDHHLLDQGLTTTGATTRCRTSRRNRPTCPTARSARSVGGPRATPPASR